MQAYGGLGQRASFRSPSLIIPADGREREKKMGSRRDGKRRESSRLCRMSQGTPALPPAPIFTKDPFSYLHPGPAAPSFFIWKCSPPRKKSGHKG
ncbi:hypothetical protein JTE90_021617 [Oedothorax gibbosus]|uniref:Uncharacterized protein n=1 Tax=Oedothorax gibbosus TaxID=931172 RepID=A0AAV6VNG8_9ARAC|nr:hypothetical protein JTE90_021617 [Oedothorax gibbosus]